MMSKGFLFPVLRHIGYTSGFSIPLRGEAEKTPDLYAEVLLFRQGCLAAQHRMELGDLAPLFYRGWDEDWFPAALTQAGSELFCAIGRASCRERVCKSV